MGKHKNAVWPVKPVGEYPQIYVATQNDKEIYLQFHKEQGPAGIRLVMSRRQARMLARRINQCLDDTK